MRRLLILVLILPSLLLLSPRAFASESPATGISPEEGLPQEIVEDVGPYDEDVSDTMMTRFKHVLSRSYARIELLGLGDCVHAVGMILAAVLLCGLLGSEEGTGSSANAVGCLAIAGVCVTQVRSMTALGAQTLDEMHNYMRLLLPGMTTLMMSSGSVSGAGAMYALSSVGFTFLLRLINDLLVPLVYLFAALSTADALLETGSLAQMRDLAKWLVVVSLKGVFYAFTACVGFTGVFTGAVDAGRLRAAKLAISGMVPLVGGLISGASQTVVAAADALKRSVGVYGMLCVLALCLTPFLRLGVQYLALKLTTAVSGLFSQGGRTALLRNMTEAMGMILAMTGISCMLALLTLTLCVCSVQPWIG